MAKLQRVQNTAARIVLDTLSVHVQPSSCSVICTGCLFTSASISKQALLTFKFLAHSRYISASLLTPYTPACTLCLQDKHLITVSTVIGRRGVSYAAAPSNWNESSLNSQ